jgi:hypothetical protein
MEEKNKFKLYSKEQLRQIKNTLEIDLLRKGISDKRIRDLDKIDEELERRENVQKNNK